MRILLAVVAALAVAAGAHAEDRTFNSVTSGLSQLINPGPQGPYPPPPPEHTYGVPSENTYGLPAEHQTYGVPAPEQPGFTVQSGYEGFIFPTGPAKDTGLEHSALGTLGGVALGYKLLTHLLPFPFNKIALFIGTKIGFWILGLLLLLLIGGATTTAVCAFTPLCTISFLGLGVFNRESTRALLTQDRLDQATQFVHDALDKYQELQGRLGRAGSKNKVKKATEADVAEAREGKELRRPVDNDIQESAKELVAEEPKKNSLDDK